MPWISNKEMDRTIRDAQRAALNSVLTMETEYQGKRFVYALDIIKLRNMLQKEKSILPFKRKTS